MKWCFLLNNADLMMEFLGKFSRQLQSEGDECIIAANSKIAEYSKLEYFPSAVKVFSKVDWLAEHYRETQKQPENVTWKEFFASFDRKRRVRTFTYQESVEIITQLYCFLDSVFRKERPDVVMRPGTISQIDANYDHYRVDFDEPVVVRDIVLKFQWWMESWMELVDETPLLITDDEFFGSDLEWSES